MACNPLVAILDISGHIFFLVLVLMLAFSACVCVMLVFTGHEFLINACAYACTCACVASDN